MLKTFDRADLEEIFKTKDIMQAIVACGELCLPWLVSQLFCNQQGKPLRLASFQSVALDMLWTKKFPIMIMTRGGGKTFLLALYALLRCILVPGSKVVICGAGYRQAKLVFKEIDKLYQQSPILQESLATWGGPKYNSDGASFKIGLSEITAIPIGDGEKIRGMRATVLICDEFASIPEETFEVVLAPFTAVHANPAQRAAIVSFLKRLETLGASKATIETVAAFQGFGNQIVLSGTASYKFNHFYKRFKTYKAFIDSRGDKEKLRKAIEERSLATSGQSMYISDAELEKMSKLWQNYAILQLPYTALPDGFLEEDTIRSSRATFSSYRFKMEYMAEFPDDSGGFIKSSMIDLATPRAPLNTPVRIELYGDPRAIYVLGVDPARWNDNCALVVLKLTARGNEVVYCKAWNKKEYGESAKHIRDVCRRFNIQYIAMDSGGGGYAIQEWLCKKQDDIKNEDLIWAIPSQIEKPSDLSAPGRKILDMVNFAGNWSADAAHGLEASINQCHLLFPHTGSTDQKDIADQFMRYYKVPEINDQQREVLNRELWGVDDWEEKHERVEKDMGALQNILECINETCAIVKDTTEGGTERFILPRMSDQPDGLDMRRRDRFSALMLANYAAKVFLGHGHNVPNLPGTSSNQRKPLTGRKFRMRGRAAY